MTWRMRVYGFWKQLSKKASHQFILFSLENYHHNRINGIALLSNATWANTHVHLVSNNQNHSLDLQETQMEKLSWYRLVNWVELSYDKKLENWDEQAKKTLVLAPHWLDDPFLGHLDFMESKQLSFSTCEQEMVCKIWLVRIHVMSKCC